MPHAKFGQDLPKMWPCRETGAQDTQTDMALYMTFHFLAHGSTCSTTGSSAVTNSTKKQVSINALSDAKIIT